MKTVQNLYLIVYSRDLRIYYAQSRVFYSSTIIIIDIYIYNLYIYINITNVFNVKNVYLHCICKHLFHEYFHLFFLFVLRFSIFYFYFQFHFRMIISFFLYSSFNPTKLNQLSQLKMTDHIY